MADQKLLRIGGAAAFGGGAIAIVGNVAHPRFPIEDLQGNLAAVIDSIASYGPWELAHGLLIIGLLLLLATFAALSRSIEGDGVAWARLAWVTAVVGVTVAVVTLIVDGFALGIAADEVAEATGGPNEAAALAAAGALEAVAVSAFGTYQVILLGLAPVLYGVAITVGDGYPTYLGWLALIAGVLGVASGLILLFAGWTTFGFLGLFSLASVLATIWILIIGWHEWRKARALTAEAVTSA